MPVSTISYIEDIAKRHDLDKQTKFVLIHDIVPQLKLNQAQLETFPNLKKAYECAKQRKKLLALLENN